MLHDSHGNGATSAFVRTHLTRSLLLTLLGALILMVLGHAAWAKGLALGGLTSAANFFIMAWLLPRALTPQGRKAQAWSLVSVTSRFGLMAVVVGLALSWPRSLSLPWCLVGLFTVQITLIIGRLLSASRVPTGAAASEVGLWKN